MNMTSLVAISAILAVSIGENALSQTRVSPTEEEVSFWDSLHEHGQRLDCFFTFEYFSTRKGPIKGLAAISRTTPFKMNSVEELADFLRKSLNEVDVVVRKSQPPVIHLKDARLVKASDYPLDQKVTLSYQGSLADLGASIHQHQATFNTAQWYAFNDLTNDDKTIVKLTEITGTVRDLLTDAVPLKGYSRFLWRTRTTKSKDGQWDSQVQYYGPQEHLKEKTQE